MELIIYRDSWRRGGMGENESLNKEFGVTSLYSAESKTQCCLGQIACHGGIPLEYLMGEGEPETIPVEYAEEAEKVSIAYKGTEYDGEEGEYEVMRNSGIADSCMPINDDTDIDDAERERQLIAVFAKDGRHTLRFVDGIAPWFQTAV